MSKMRQTDPFDQIADDVLNSIFDQNFVGKLGEFYTGVDLKLAGLLGARGRTLKNLYLPKDDGGTSEIDLVYITQCGIFVIESKNYSGWIFGDEKSSYWTSMLPNKQKNRFYNPILQNMTHMRWLSKYLGDDEKAVPMFSLIVFSERCELKKISYEKDHLLVIKRDDLIAAIRNTMKVRPAVMTEEEVEKIFRQLSPLTHADAETKASHIEEIKKKETICPWCGSELVLRTARKGQSAGNQFWGCSGYPKCRYTRPIKTDEAAQ